MNNRKCAECWHESALWVTCWLLSMLEQLIEREADIFGYLTEQDWGDIPTLMKWNRCATACGITELFVRSALADFGETEFDQDGDDFMGLEDGNVAHNSSDGNVLDSDELGLEHGFAVFQKHGNNIMQIVVDFIQCFSLGMGAGETRNKTDEQASLWASLNYR